MTPLNLHIAIVCHPAAGKGRALRLAHRLEDLLRGRQIPFMLFTDPWPAGFSSFSRVFVVGGDGTLHYFINRYPDITVPLAIFKGGSGNDFAWRLYGGISFEMQAERVLKAIPRPMDAGSCNGRLFINGVGIGFDGEVARALNKGSFWPSGHFRYMVTVLRQLFFYREKRLRIYGEGHNREGRFFMITIANGSRYGGGFLVSPHSAPDDGRLDLVTIDALSPFRRFVHIHKMKKGKHLSLSIVHSEPATRIEVEATEAIAAHADGEFFEAKYFHCEILPRKFQFLY